ncbi:SecY-interacting protein [Photobacterium aphoticum]|uniref:Protein Syd n=1 Tax=Photobacterium aphoticum TaxID=754436 RepID=A0A090QWT8_9GAMM|nr:SecY-interacting protein [Photobacterium aphoticum]KLV01504.1 secretion protein [Photobacterium aphoticum]PSU55244.1 SecY-interacting protein [Photobacterium aphoticum]GAL07660.1 Syd protein [Photobacterium aphoticum]GHA59642.1 protein Syd [Photobacterium aphoticum]
MNHPVAIALSAFSERFLQAWCDAGQGFPRSGDLVGLSSDCVCSDDGYEVSWKPVARLPMGDLAGVEQGIELRLHEDITAFYGSQFSGDMTARFETVTGMIEFDLLQAFNLDDVQRLQENILGHLVTQRRLKLKPTVFIGAMDSEHQVIAVCNLTGNVVLETLGKSEREVLADDVASFLDALTPVVKVN